MVLLNGPPKPIQTLNVYTTVHKYIPDSIPDRDGVSRKLPLAVLACVQVWGDQSLKAKNTAETLVESRVATH